MDTLLHHLCLSGRHHLRIISADPFRSTFPCDMDDDPTSKALAVAREQVRHTIERLDEIRADLEATAAGFRLPERGEDVDAPLAGLHELDAVIRCGLHDHLRPLIASLRSLP